MNVHSGRELTDDVIAILTAGGLTVGDAQAPANVPAGAGYVVVYPLAGGTVNGPLANPSDDADVPYQLNSLGTSRRQAEGIADRARTLMLSATNWSLPGRVVSCVDIEMLGGVRRDDDTAAPAKFYTTDQYVITTTPA